MTGSGWGAAARMNGSCRMTGLSTLAFQRHIFHFSHCLRL